MVQMVQIFPRYDEYVLKTARTIPIVLLTPVERGRADS
jgi:hypothetical protein